METPIHSSVREQSGLFPWQMCILIIMENDRVLSCVVDSFSAHSMVRTSLLRFFGFIQKYSQSHSDAKGIASKKESSAIFGGPSCIAAPRKAEGASQIISNECTDTFMLRYQRHEKYEGYHSISADKSGTTWCSNASVTIFHLDAWGHPSCCSRVNSAEWFIVHNFLNRFASIISYLHLKIKQ